MDWQQYIEKILGVFRGIWRYRWYGLLTTWVFGVVAWIIIAMLPDHYRADASVYIDTESMIKPLVKELTVTSDIDERIQQSSRTLLTRPNVERIAKMADLDFTVNTADEKEALLDKLEQKIKLEREGHSNLFKISYETENPKVAKLVVQSVLNLFIEATLGDKRTDTSVAQKFLDEQLAYYEQELIKAEKDLAEFKRKNIGTLPNEDSTYYESLKNILNEKQQIETDLVVAESRKFELTQQLNGELPTIGLMVEGSSRQFETLKDNLIKLKLLYTENHPTIKRLEEQLKRLSVSENAEASGLTLREQDNLDQNPVYQQMKISLSEASTDVAEIKARLLALNKSEAKLREKVDKVIQAETELANLNRGYLIDKSHYQALLERKESAKMSESLDNMTGTIDFRIVDPPFVPLEPTGPNRFLLSCAAFMLSCIVGMGAAFARSQVMPAFYDKLSVMQHLNLPILATIPKISAISIEERQYDLKQLYVFSLSCMLFIMILAVYNVFYFIKV